MANSCWRRSHEIRRPLAELEEKTAMDLHYDPLYIGGAWLSPATNRRISPIDASTEQVLGSVPEGAEADIDTAVAAARRAFDDPQGWASWEPKRRAEVMDRFADALDRRAEAIVERVSSQNGMPRMIGQQLEAGFPTAILRFYADLAHRMQTVEERPGVLGGTVEVRKNPVGVVAAITPWNFPQ